MGCLRLLKVLFPLLFLMAFSGCTVIIQQKTIRYIRYTVNKGDSVSSIAKRFNVAMAEIQEINEIRDPKSLQPGDFVKIPYRGQPLSKKDEEIVRKNLVVLNKPVAAGSAVRTVRLSSAGIYIGKLKWPLKTEGRVSSGFGRRWFSFHEGLDIADKEGTPIVAAHAGKIVYSGSGLRGYGNLVIVQTEGLMTVYGHNKLNRVKVGDTVTRGQWIADLGSTGKSTGPHVHFETRIKGEDGKFVAVDPMAFFP